MPPTGTDSPTYTHGASSTEKQQQWRRQHHVPTCPHVYVSMCVYMCLLRAQILGPSVDMGLTLTFPH